MTTREGVCQQPCTLVVRRSEQEALMRASTASVASLPSSAENLRSPMAICEGAREQVSHALTMHVLVYDVVMCIQHPCNNACMDTYIHNVTYAAMHATARAYG